MARPMETGEVPRLSEALASAFADDAMMAWMLPQRTRRMARRRSMFRLELQTYVLPQDGLVITAGDADGELVGGCLALPPDRWAMPRTMDGHTAMRWLGVYGSHLPRAARVRRLMEEHHPSEPHYYIRWVGVRPGHQRQGIGRTLMKPVLDRCDRDNLPAYIEASSRGSAALYARLGFVHQDELRLPDNGPPLWPMRRPAAG